MILVTGGSGLLGSHLIAGLLLNHHQIKVLIRSEESKQKIIKILRYYSNNADNLLMQVEWAYGDVLDLESLYVAMEKVEFVYHCAGVVSFDNTDRKKMLDINIRGTANVVNTCLEQNVKKMVHVSSVAAIRNNNSDQNINTEENGWPVSNTLDYSYSKTQGEFEVWRGIAEGLNAIIINPSVILGEGNWNSGSSKFFPTVYKGLKYFTRGITGYVDVADLVKIMLFLMKSEIHSQRYIISAENLSFESLLKKIAVSMGVKGPNIYASPFLTNLGRILESVKAAILFSRPFITKQTAKSAHNIKYYSSSKLLNTIDFSFTPIDTTIDRVSKQYINDLNLK